VKHGALVTISNKYGDMPLTKARPRLRKKLEGERTRGWGGRGSVVSLTLLFFCLCTAMAAEFGQSLVIIPHKSKLLELL